MAHVDMRGYEYGKCAAALRNNFESSGAEAMFDQGLTNGLLAIVAEEWPGQEQDRRSMKSAMKLLEVIEQMATEVGPGVFGFVPQHRPSLSTDAHLPLNFGPDDSSPQIFHIAVSTLREAVRRTQVVRHGRLMRADETHRLELQHIEALCALDAHPALFTLSEGERDRSWFEAKVFDLWSRGNAEEYLALVGDEEADRRAELAGYYAPAPGDVGGPYIQGCPVCMREGFIAQRLDDLGNNVGIGVCIVCSYSRSEIIADDEAMAIEWETRWADR